MHARVLATDGRGGHPIVGLVQTGGASDKLQRWTKDGFCIQSGQESENDLVEMLTDDLNTGFSAQLDSLKTSIADASAVYTIKSSCRQFSAARTVQEFGWMYDIADIHLAGYEDVVEEAFRYLELRGMIEVIGGPLGNIVKIYSSPAQRINAMRAQHRKVMAEQGGI